MAGDGKPLATFVSQLGRNPTVKELYSRRAARRELAASSHLAVDLPFVPVPPWRDVEPDELPTSKASSSPHKAVALLREHDWEIMKSSRRLSDARLWARLGAARAVLTFTDRKLETSWLWGTHWTRASWADLAALIEEPDGLLPEREPEAEAGLPAFRAVFGGYVVAVKVQREGMVRADFFAPRIVTERAAARHLVLFHNWTKSACLATTRGTLIEKHRAAHLAEQSMKRHRHVADVLADEVIG